ncbi:MAG: hypothetical protein K2N34_09025 [Lachnospiraceae bacterium]|nr:hypothetical protein [Lachnospiraceae bacterium]
MRARVYDKINDTYYISEVYGWLNFGGDRYIVGRQEQEGLVLIPETYNGTCIKALGMRWRVKEYE